MLWKIQFFPQCKYHVFLSHTAEDRESLVYPVYKQLLRKKTVPWIDRHEYPYGRTSRSALRDSILLCRHVIFFITDSMLTQSRGWCVQELAWTELLQDNLILSGGPALQNVILPLFFIEQSDPRLPRSVWQATRDRGLFCSAKSSSIPWAVEHIEKFLNREKNLSQDFLSFAQKDLSFRRALKPTSGLFDRVTKFEPKPLAK